MPRLRITLLLPLLCALQLSAAPATLPAADEDEQGFVPIFNGKDLTGWEGKPGWWYVEDGAITSQSTREKPCLKHNYLMWRGGKPGDFELRLKYKLVGGNSGIQIRSQERPDFDTYGYQADMDDTGQWTGALFEHKRGGIAMRGERVVIDEAGKKTVERFADGAELKKHVRVDDWNDYRIVCKGNVIALYINGHLMAQATDDQKGQAARSGIIALQMHPGPPMKVQFKDIRLKDLSAPPAERRGDR